MAAPQHKIIVTCAITGGIHTPGMSPHLPVTAGQIAREAIAAARAGAPIVHLHARRPETGEPSQDPALLRAFLPAIAAPSDVVVNLSSTIGSRGNARNAPYGASKHAVEGLTKAAALEAARSGVRVNAVAPGPSATGMLDRIAGGADQVAGVAATIAAGRIGTPEEVADAIVFLASGRPRYITGQVLAVNGGKTAM